MQRSSLLDQLVVAITAIERPHPTRVGIDGLDAAGKTTLADELALLIEAAGRSCVRAEIDDFHPLGHKDRSISGGYTPETYYTEAFNHEALLRFVLAPLSPDGDRRCRLRLNDSYHDVPFAEEWHAVEENAVLVVDGVFLQRPELAAHWDYYIWLDIDEETSLARSRERDVGWKAEDLVIDHHAHRNMPAFQRYFAESKPVSQADIVIDNRDPEAPEIVRF